MRNHITTLNSHNSSFCHLPKFPFIGSACLFGLFCAFKFLDPEWVNWVISFYFTAAGAIAVAGTLIPILEIVPLLGKTWSRKFSFKHPLPEAVLGPR